MKLNQFEENRLLKKNAIEEEGYNPYHCQPQNRQTIESIKKNFQEGQTVSVTGRIMLKRGHGKTNFFTLKDNSGQIQLYSKSKELEPTDINLINACDIGDIIWVIGSLFKTKTEEMTIRVKQWRYASKALKEFPEKWHKLQNTDTRYRNRPLDLIMNDEVKERFYMRFHIIKMIRNFFDKENFFEVETPMMQEIAGGAVAQPFITHHNSLDRTLYLRIAPELYLKRLLVGGFEKVFELNRNFRNEGLSPRHNPEFTMLEAYAIFHNYIDMMNLTENLIQHLNQSLPQQEHSFNLSQPFKRITMKNAVAKHLGINIDTLTPQTLQKKLNRNDIPQGNHEELLFWLFEEYIEKELIEPTFITEYPSYLCPLCQKDPQNEKYSQRFELFINGMEIANAYSELNDPIEQQKRFLRQQGNRDNEENYEIDQGFIEALHYGMPPAGGLGIGIDRLVMLLTNADNIREVILFPHLRNKDTSS